jgi:inhibitor of the pro-sigma K processing machinery
MHIDVAIAYLVGILLLYFLARIFIIPIRFVVRMIFNGVIGGVLLWLTNLGGRFIGIAVPVNPITALIAGFLGVPGVVLVIILQYLFRHNPLF